MNKVLVMDSAYDDRAQALEQSFAAFPLDIEGKTVVIKPNALKHCDPDSDIAMVPHNKVLEAVINKVECPRHKQIAAPRTITVC